MDSTIPTLGPPRYDSPLQLSTKPDDCIADFTSDTARLPIDPIAAPTGLSFELAGPRQRGFFAGPDVVAGIVTCGGLCPGMNNVIRGIVNTLWQHYGTRRIHGFRYGYRGLVPNTPDPPIELTLEGVRDIHLKGGSALGSSRGPQDVSLMVDTLDEMGVNALFIIGGDGTLRGAHAIHKEIHRRGQATAVIAVPKTIDNDIPFIERTFGFETAVACATTAIRAAHVEAMGAPRGLGIVRLMGRHSGFIAASATMAARVVDLILVPELPFSLQGEHGILAYLQGLLQQKGHCVLVVAEGAGQHLLESANKKCRADASGNRKLGDIGIFLRDACRRELNVDALTVKYIDPSYIIRAAPADPGDAIFCGSLAQDAVHAAMAGKTGMVVGLWLNRATHVPLSMATNGRKLISLDGSFWRNVMDVTGQPLLTETCPG